MKPICIDFEYNSSAEPHLNLVCASFKFEGNNNSIWLLDNEENKIILRDWLLEHKAHPIIAFNAVAEGQSFIALGLNPRDFQWIDLQIEMKMLMNSDEEFELGEHLSKNEIVNIVRKPSKYDFENSEDWDAECEALKEKGFDFKPPFPSLVTTAYKLCKLRIDSEEKDQMRDLIIAGGPFTEESKDKILLYCESDVDNTWQVYKWFNKNKFPNYTREDVFLRGRTAANCANIVARGYPINLKKVKNLRANMPSLFKDLIQDINSQFDFEVFRWNNLRQNFSMNQKSVIAKVKEQNAERIKSWPKTAKGEITLSMEPLEKMFDIKHSFKAGNMIHQYIRYKRFETSLKSLRGVDKDKDFLNYVGSDERVRSWLNPYGAQTGRYQPPSTQFLFLKTAWLRSLCEPKAGRVVIGIDYGSQEFLLQAAMAEDKTMFDSYASGDVYVAFGKLVGLIPKDKQEGYKLERAVAKAAVLGIGYGMGAAKLALKITDDSGKVTTEEEAREIIDGFFETYSDYAQLKKDIYSTYKTENELSLPDGWKMFGDNPSKNSILNFPVQGLGSCVMRKAIDLCLDRGLEVIFPLHDALYIECNLSDWKQKVLELASAMREASGFYLSGESKEWAESVRLDADVWGPNLLECYETLGNINVKLSPIYIDERAKKEYEQFSKYFKEVELNF